MIEMNNFNLDDPPQNLPNKEKNQVNIGDSEKNDGVTIKKYSNPLSPSSKKGQEGGFVPLARNSRHNQTASDTIRPGEIRRKSAPYQAGSGYSSPAIPLLGGKRKDRVLRPSSEDRAFAMKQAEAPLAQALLEYKKSRVVSFDVPGHKQGKGNKALVEYLGEDCVSIDVNSMKPLDNLIHPVSVIKEAEELAAEAFGAAHAFFMVGGTSSSVQTMVMSTCREGEKIIMPRNVHRSALNALILTGAVPVYVDPGINSKLGIPLGMSVENVQKAINENPDAKAVLVNNPTYYGVCGDISKIVQIAHEAGMLVLADEAHGTHLYFGDGLPTPAIKAGADMAAVSIHKTGGSLTQSSLLLISSTLNPGYVRQIINLTQTTSASYLLMSSLDISRRNLALNGKEIFKKVVNMADYARREVNDIGGYYAFSSDDCNGSDFFAFDRTKLSIHTQGIGLAGIEVYDLLRDEYGIQIEFGDIGNCLAILSIGDREMEIERLIAALSEIKRLYAKPELATIPSEYMPPSVMATPRQAFYSDKFSLPLEESIGKICGEFIMCYPPGIPILAPGELITQEAVNYIHYAKEHGCNMTGTQDLTVNHLQVLL